MLVAQVRHELQRLDHLGSVQGGHVRSRIQHPATETTQERRQPEGLLSVVDQPPGTGGLVGVGLGVSDQFVPVGRCLGDQGLVVEQHQVVA